MGRTIATEDFAAPVVFASIQTNMIFLPVFRIRIHVILGLPDPDPSVIKQI